VTKRALPYLLARKAEKKYEDKVFDDSLISASPIVQNMSLIAAGTSVNSRTGNVIQVTGIYGKFLFSNSLDATNPTNKAYYGRVILWMPRGDISVTSLDADPGTNIDPDRYIVFFDKTVPIPWANSISNSMVTMKKSFKPYMNMTFDSSSNDSVEKNKLQVSIFSNTNAAIVECAGNIRMYYRDL
jgi:hypothetical protein